MMLLVCMATVCPRGTMACTPTPLPPSPFSRPFYLQSPQRYEGCFHDMNALTHFCPPGGALLGNFLPRFIVCNRLSCRRV